MAMQEDPRLAIPPWLWLGALAAIILLFVGAIIGLASTPLYDRPAASAAVPTSGNITVAQIVNNSPSYEGKTVALTGQVVEVISARAIRIVDQGAGEELSLLVMAAQAEVFPTGIAPGDLIQTTGPVNRFVLSQVERQIGTSLGDSRLTSHEGRAFLLSQSLSRAPGS